MSSGWPTVKLSFASEVKGMDSTTGHSGLMSTELLYVTCCSAWDGDQLHITVVKHVKHSYYFPFCRVMIIIQVCLAGACCKMGARPL